MKRLLRATLIILILAANVGCDQISKKIVRQTVSFNEDIAIIANRVTLTRVENSGAFLSIGDSLPQPVKSLLLIVFPLAALAFAAVYLFRERRLSRLETLGIACVVGGGAGNIYDRIAYGSVTDFLHVDLVFFQTGIFNLADVSVMTGVSLIIVSIIFRPHVPAKEIQSE